MTVQTVKDERIAEMRAKMDFIQSKMELLGPLLGKAFIRDKLKVWRHVITVPVRNMPKISELHAFLSHPVFDVGNLVKNIEFPSSYREMSIKQLKYLLEMPERHRDNIKDMTDKRVSRGKFSGHMLRNRHAAIDYGVNPFVQAQLTQKEIDRLYKKYLKAFKEDDLIDYKRFIDDDMRRRKKK